MAFATGMLMPVQVVSRDGLQQDLVLGGLNSWELPSPPQGTAPLQGWGRDYGDPPRLPRERSAAATCPSNRDGTAGAVGAVGSAWGFLGPVVQWGHWCLRGGVHAAGPFVQCGPSCDGASRATGPLVLGVRAGCGGAVPAVGSVLAAVGPPMCDGAARAGGAALALQGQPCSGAGGNHSGCRLPPLQPSPGPAVGWRRAGGLWPRTPDAPPALPLTPRPGNKPTAENHGSARRLPARPPWLPMGGLGAAPAAPLPTALPLPPKAGGDRGHGDPPRVAMPGQDPRLGAVALTPRLGGGLGTPLMPRLPSGQVWREAHGTRTPGPPLRQTPAPQPLTPRGPPRPAPGSPSR